MKLIIAYIQPGRLEKVKEELHKAKVYRISVSNALGCGQQRGAVGLEANGIGGDEGMNLRDKIRLEIAVNDKFVEVTINAILNGARNYHMGDGKIFVIPMDECIRIRTSERGMSAIGGYHGD